MNSHSCFKQAITHSFCKNKMFCAWDKILSLGQNNLSRDKTFCSCRRMGHKIHTTKQIFLNPDFCGYNLRAVGPQHAKLDLNKKLLPKQKTIKTLRYNPKGFKITINENPPMVDFFGEQIFGFLTRD